MPMLTLRDGAELYYKDWGGGPPVVFSHGWPLSSDSWEDQMMFLAGHGYRCIAHDRRGHGRSSQPWQGNDMDSYADDLAELLDHLDVRGIVLAGFSTGGGEVTRYIGRHGTSRVAKLVLVSAIPPFMLRTDDNPGGVPMDVFDGIRAGTLADRSQFFHDLSDGPFFGADRPGATVSQGLRETFWLQGMQCGLKAAHDCVAAFSESDFRDDLAKVDVPVLIVHGSDDQVVPVDVGGRATAKRLPDATYIEYEGAPHGLAMTLKDRLNADLLAFVKG